MESITLRRRLSIPLIAAAIVATTALAWQAGDDLAKSAVLLIDGREVAPIGWSGAGPGGHHREGLLRFPAPAQPPAAVELRIQRDKEPSPRVFRWDGVTLR